MTIKRFNKGNDCGIGGPIRPLNLLQVKLKCLAALAKGMKSRPMSLAAVILALVIADGISAQVVISEFMAKNDKTWADGDGNYSDWIELYNRGAESIDLTGWYLSDDPTDLTQWKFPSTHLAAGDHLVVFASGQEVDDFTDRLGYLHTSFKLSAAGESILLTQPDGITIEHSFVDYPAQEDDISYGLAQESSYSYLVVEDQDATVLIGTSEPASHWNATGFDDSTWLSGQTGVGFEKVSTGGGSGGRPPRPGEETGTPVYTSMINLDVSSMSGVTESAYIRVVFTLDGTESLSQLSLRMKYDDGFVAYVNGRQVASANAPALLSNSSTANAEHDGIVYEEFTIIDADTFLQTGKNVLAIHGLNEANDTTDFFIMPVLTGIRVGELQTNVSMFYNSATPGTDNVSGVLGYVEDTSFTVNRGFFTNAFEVEINCDTEGADIYYTVDGTPPAADNGTLYSDAITIDKTTVLRAAAFLAGYQPSKTDTQTYLFLRDIIAQGADATSLAPEFPSGAVNGQSFDYGMDAEITQSAAYSDQIEDALTAIPSISIVTHPDNLFDPASGIYVNADEEGDAWERETSVELINPDGTEGFQINGGMRIRGESSTTSSNPKHSFRFLFRSEYGTSRLHYALFGDEGAESFKRMDLRTGQNFSWAHQTPQYATWLYDIFTRDTHRDMNQPHTRGDYYHLYINGMYWGLYQTEERCDSRYAQSYYGGDVEDFDAIKADGDTGNMYALDGSRDAYEELWAGITAGVSENAAYFALQGMNPDGSANSSFTRLLDVDNVIDYMLLVYFTANRDSPIGPPHSGTMPRNLNAIYNRAQPDGFKFVAHDNEHSLEIQQGVNHNRFRQTLSSSFNGIDRMTPWWMHLKLMENEEYALRFADHVHEHFFNDGALTPAQTAHRLESRRDEIYAAVVAESARWGDSKGTLRTRDNDWLNAVNWLLNSYFPYRTDIVLGQIEDQGWYPSVDAPEFNQHGGSIDAGFSLTMSGSSTIYFTTDGSDPRKVGGHAAGTVYVSAITLTQSTQVKARVLDDGIWSALTQATFVMNEESPLRVTEIMYHPADASSDAEAAYEASDFEFIEIMNTGDETVGLAGTQFSEGIVFDFTAGDVAALSPGEYAILVRNHEAFTQRYSHWENIRIAGQYYGKFFIATGALDNAGENITLVDGLGNVILDFEYSDWYDRTDGDGYSLTIVDPTAPRDTWSHSDSWRASTSVGGTPGEAATGTGLDSDSDGMDDSWEMIYFGSTNAINGGPDDDWDGDGSSNLTEFRAGTHPTDIESAFRLTAIRRADTATTLSWASESGVSYTIQSTSDLGGADWMTLESGITATPPTNRHTSTSTHRQVFYRILAE